MRRREFIAGLGRAAVAVPNRKYGVGYRQLRTLTASRTVLVVAHAHVSARTVLKPSPTR